MVGCLVLVGRVLILPRPAKAPMAQRQALASRLRHHIELACREAKGGGNLDRADGPDWRRWANAAR